MIRIPAPLRRLALWFRRRAVLARHVQSVEAQLTAARQHEACERARADGLLRDLAELKPELAALRRLQQRMVEAQAAYERSMSAQQEAR